MNPAWASPDHDVAGHNTRTSPPAATLNGSLPLSVAFRCPRTRTRKGKHAEFQPERRVRCHRGPGKQPPAREHAGATAADLAGDGQVMISRGALAAGRPSWPRCTTPPPRLWRPCNQDPAHERDRSPPLRNRREPAVPGRTAASSTAGTEMAAAPSVMPAEDAAS